MNHIKRQSMFLVLFLFCNVALADKWVFIGDSLTVGMIGNGRDFKARMQQAYSVQIEVVNTSRVGKRVTEYVREIDSILRRHPNARYFPILIGANDVRAYSERKARWLRSKLVTILGKIVAAGRVPILMRLTYNRRQEGDPRGSFNVNVYDPLIRQYSPRWFNEGENKGLIDVHGWVRSHQQYLARDGVHLTASGYRAARQELLVETMARVVYGSANANSGQRDISLIGNEALTVSQQQVVPAAPISSAASAVEKELALNLELVQLVDNRIDRCICLSRACELVEQMQSSGVDRESIKPQVELIQRELEKEGISPGRVDGLYGPKTTRAAQKMKVATAQRMLSSINIDPGPVDGIEGPLTRAALDKYWQGKNRSRPFQSVNSTELAALRFCSGPVRCD